MEETKDEIVEQRYKRLMLLLSKSQFYSQYLEKKFATCREDKISNRPRKRLKTGHGKENSGLMTLSLQENSHPKKINSNKLVTLNSCHGLKESQSNQENLSTLFDIGKLRSYQHDGFVWLKTLYENHVNGILADEMGLGKTVQCVAMLSHLITMGLPGPFLIVAPLSTLPNWLTEFYKFAPKIPTLLYHGTQKIRKSKSSHFRKVLKIEGHNFHCCPVVITSYEVAIKDVTKLKSVFWQYLIVDEAHRIKNHKCRLSKALCSIDTRGRLLLTGTPLQNSLSELWSLFHFLLPEIFDSLDVFESWFEVEALMHQGVDQHIVAQERDKQIVSTLHKILNPFLLRRVKKDVCLEIPKKKELLVYTPMTPLQIKLYKATLAKDISSFHNIKVPEEVVQYDQKGHPKRRCKDGIKDLSILLNPSNSVEAFDRFLNEALKQSTPTTSIVERPKSLSRINPRNIMMQCQKVVNHPYLLDYPLQSNGEYKIDNDLLTTSGKLLVLDQLLKELHRTGHKVLLFSQMTTLLDIIEDYLTLRPHFKYKRLDGDVSLEDRITCIHQFNNNSSIFLFLLSTRAGGVGINLTAADTVIIYDSDWNPQQDLQAQARCHRIGQYHPVLILRFVTPSTIEQRKVERTTAKRKLEKIIMSSNKFKTSIFTQNSSEPDSNSLEDLLSLLQTPDFPNVYDTVQKNGVLSDNELKCLLDRRDIEGKDSNLPLRKMKARRVIDEEMKPLLDCSDWELKDSNYPFRKTKRRSQRCI